MNKQIEMNYVLDKPNINGIVYERESYLKALDKYIKENGKIYDNIDKLNVIGKVNRYELKDDVVILEVEIDDSIQSSFNISSHLLGDNIPNENVCNIYEVNYLHTDINYDEDCKKYYEDLRGK